MSYFIFSILGCKFSTGFAKPQKALDWPHFGSQIMQGSSLIRAASGRASSPVASSGFLGMQVGDTVAVGQVNKAGSCIRIPRGGRNATFDAPAGMYMPQACTSSPNKLATPALLFHHKQLVGCSRVIAILGAPDFSPDS